MATTSPDAIYSPDAGQQYALTQDLAAMADSVQDALTARSRYRSGTSAERAAWTSPGEGALFYSSNLDQIHVYQSGAWVLVWPEQRARGLFTGVSSPTGTVTVNHGLGVTPSYVSATNTNYGTIPGVREVVFNTANSTQIQFVVYNGGATLGNNAVGFYWEASA